MGWFRLGLWWTWNWLDHFGWQEVWSPRNHSLVHFCFGWTALVLLETDGAASMVRNGWISMRFHRDLAESWQMFSRSSGISMGTTWISTNLIQNLAGSWRISLRSLWISTDLAGSAFERGGGELGRLDSVFHAKTRNFRFWTWKSIIGRRWCCVGWFGWVGQVTSQDGQPYFLVTK